MTTRYQFMLTDHTTGDRMNLIIESTVDEDGYDVYEAWVYEPGFEDEVSVHRMLNAALGANAAVGTTSLRMVEPVAGMDQEDIEDLLIAVIVQMEYANPELEGLLQDLNEAQAEA